MNVEINKDNNKVKLLQNDGTLIIEGTWKEVEDKLLELLTRKER